MVYPDERVEALAVFVLLVSSPPADSAVLTKASALVEDALLAKPAELIVAKKKKKKITMK